MSTKIKKIGHASISEKNSVNGEAGDSTGKEVCLVKEYNISRIQPYIVLRPKSNVLAEASARACIAGCRNNHIGYSQSTRNTLNTYAKAVGYDLANVTTDCNTDCSAFMTVCAIAGGANIDYGGAFVATHTGGSTSKYTTQGSAVATNNGWSFDASRSSAIYSDSATTVQPNAIRYLVMVQLATSTTDTALETCTSVLADVAELKYDYVVDFQAPTSSNNYTWYRKYKSGWVEQGGCYSQNIGTGDTAWSATLPVPMSDNNYTALVNINGGNSGNTTIQCEGNTSTVIKGYGRSPGGAVSKKIMWQVSGMAASS
jgi:hypothetical protein